MLELELVPNMFNPSLNKILKLELSSSQVWAILFHDWAESKSLIFCLTIIVLCFLVDKICYESFNENEEENKLAQAHTRFENSVVQPDYNLLLFLRCTWNYIYMKLNKRICEENET